MKKVLTIAGSDSSGGAGIQADLKTILSHNCYGMSVITALTAQNTCAVYSTLAIDSDFIAEQLDVLLADMCPDSIKIGMLLNMENVKVIAEKLANSNVKNIVLDPVMLSSSGRRLLSDEGILALKTELLALVDILTPNLSEAEVLSGLTIKTKSDMILAAKEISKYYSGYILIKGGHSKENSDDLLYKDNNIKWFKAKNIINPNSHGTGCTLSSAIACNLAIGYKIDESVAYAKEYIELLLNDKMDIGRGSGPLNHTIKASHI